MKKVLLLASLAMAVVSCKKSEKQPQPTQLPVRHHTSTLHIAWDAAANPNPKCFLDVDSGFVFDPQEAKPRATEIDFWWVARPFYNDASFASPDATDNMGYTGFEKSDLGMHLWSRLNHSLIEASDQITHAEFDAIKTVPELIEAWERDEPVLGYAFMTVTNTQLGYIYTFETAQRKRGLIRFKDGVFGPDGHLVVEIKIEP